MKNQVILISVPLDELMSQMRSIIQEEIKKGLPEPEPDATTYSINQVRTILHRGPDTIKKLIEQNVLKTTVDGRIPASEISKYLENKI